jgi:hypothetical protein
MNFWWSNTFPCLSDSTGSGLLSTENTNLWIESTLQFNTPSNLLLGNLNSILSFLDYRLHPYHATFDRATSSFFGAWILQPVSKAYIKFSTSFLLSSANILVFPTNADLVMSCLYLLFLAIPEIFPSIFLWSSDQPLLETTYYCYPEAWLWYSKL